MPKLAAFPKAFMTQLCRTGEMTLADWVELAMKDPERVAFARSSTAGCPVSSAPQPVSAATSTMASNGRRNFMSFTMR